MKNLTHPLIFEPAHLPVKIKAATVTGFISIATGVLVLIGWVFHVSILQTIIPGYSSMKFNTAFEFVLLGYLLLLNQFQIQKRFVIISLILCSVFTVIAFISLAETIFKFDAGIDQLFIADITSRSLNLPYPGRMSPSTATCFIYSGLALLGFAAKSSIVQRISQYFLNLVTAASAVALIGYLYGLSPFYSLNFTGSMAIHTAVLFFFTSLTASWLHPSIGINKLFSGGQVGNTMAKRVLTIGVYITLLFGILRVVAKQFKLFSFNEGISILIISFIGAGFVMVWNMAKWLNKIDQGRRDAEREVVLVNEQLELRVKERSQKLSALVARYRETEAKFKAAFEHSAIGIALVTLKGKWFQVNRSLCDMMGYKEQELLTMSFESIYGDNRMIYPHLENEILTTVGNSGTIERRYQCKDGSIVWISVNTAAVNNKKGGAIYFVSQFEDITKRKNAESNLKAAYKDIENQVKIIQGVAWKQSHLIRRPLANLPGLTALLKHDDADSEILQHIEQELNALDNIIIEMAEDAAGKGINKITAKNRTFKAAS